MEINEKTKKQIYKKTKKQIYNFLKRIKSGTPRGCHSLLMDRKKMLQAASN